MDKCNCSRKKERTLDGKRTLLNRINRISGQVNAIGRMIDEDFYCPDVLLQIKAVRSALESLSKVMLAEHINTCVLEDIKQGRDGAAEELCELISKIEG